MFSPGHEAHLVCVSFVPVKEPRTDLQLIAWLTGQCKSLGIVHLVRFRQRGIERTSLGARGIFSYRHPVFRVRVPPLPFLFLDTISVAENDLRTA